MKLLTKVLLLVWLCQSPILGISQLFKSKKYDDRIKVAQTSLTSCRETLSKLAVIRQEDTLWCYAATTQMILQYYKKPIQTQCEIVNNLFDGHLPCSPACGSNKNTPISRALPCSKNQDWVNYFKSIDSAEFENTTIQDFNIDAVIAQLNTCNPVIGLFNTSKQSYDATCTTSHAVVMIGYFEEKAKRAKGKYHFLILDPLKVCTGCKYFMAYWGGDFRSAYGNTQFAVKDTKIITFK